MTHRYTAASDGWLAFITPARLLFVAGSPDAATIDRLWTRIRDERGPAGVLETLTANGLFSTPPFAFVELGEGIEGLVHVSEIADGRVDDPRAVLSPGQAVEVEVISIDQVERKIGLSMKSASRSAELAEAQGYAGTAHGATLGDVFRKKGLTKA